MGGTSYVGRKVGRKALYECKPKNQGLSCIYMKEIL